MSAAYFEHLAAARGIAAGIVFLSHLIQIHLIRFSGLGTPLHQVSSIASEYSVLVFFVLSGYLITHAIEANIKRNGSLALGQFVAARIARIYPPFLFAVFVSIGVFIALDAFDLPGRKGPLSLADDLYAARDIVNLSAFEVKQALLMKQGMLEINGPLWSLYIEVKLYIIFACCVALLDKRFGVIKKSLLLVIIAIVAKTGIEQNPGFVFYSAIWLAGATGYYMWNPTHRRLAGLSLCAFLIIMAATWGSIQHNGNSPTPWAGVRDFALAMAAAWLLFKVKIKLPVYMPLAECSYSLYVCHFPVLLLVQSILISFGSASLVGAVGASGVSILAVIALARIGGALEARKSIIQLGLLRLAERASRKRFGS